MQYSWALGQTEEAKCGLCVPSHFTRASLLLSLSHGSSFPTHFPKCHLFCSPLTIPRNKCAHAQHRDEDTVSERVGPLPKVILIKAARQEFQPGLQKRMLTLFHRKGKGDTTEGVFLPQMLLASP